MDLEKKIEGLAAQDKQDTRIQALISLAELQQSRQDHLDDALASLTDSVAKMDDGIRSLIDSGKATDQRVSALVSAIGEWIRRGLPTV